jgi:hypothetical protein
LKKAGRCVVLGPSPDIHDTSRAAFLWQHAQMWRISDDFWDCWIDLKRQLCLPEPVRRTVEPGGLTDAAAGPHRYPGRARLSRDEATRLAAPLDERALSLDLPQPSAACAFTARNDHHGEVLAVNQQAVSGPERSRAQSCGHAGISQQDLALFHTGDTGEEQIRVAWSELGVSGPCTVRNPRVKRV